MNKPILFIIFFLLLLNVQTYASVIKIQPAIIDDVLVKENQPNTNFHYTTYKYILPVGYAVSAGNRLASLIRIDPTGLPSNIIRANLSLYASAWGYDNNLTDSILFYKALENWTEANATWNRAQTLISDSILNQTMINWTSHLWYNFTITEALETAITTSTNLSLYFIFNRSSGVDTSLHFASTETYLGASKYPILYLETNGSSCNYNGEPLGTTCLNAEDYATNLDYCTVEYGKCPEGTLCSAFTPVINATSDIGLVENWTGCDIITQLGVHMQCFNVCFNNYVIASNCIYDQCKQCGDAYGLIYFNGTKGFFTKTWVTNQPTISVAGNTIGCFNTQTSTYDKIINVSGEETTEIDILQQSGNIIQPITPPSTSQGTCNDANLDYTSGFNCGIGSLFNVRDIATSNFISSLLYSLFLSIGMVGVTNKIGIKGNMLGQVFLLSTLILLVMFTFIGWIPAWLMVILIVLSGLMVAKSLKVF